MMHAPELLSVREASPEHVETLVRLINTAFAVERFFVDRDRTDAETVRSLMAKGAFLLALDGSSAPVACVYVERRGESGYFGLLAVDPAQQGRGYARQLVSAVEQRFRDAGCRRVDLSVVNLRAELPPFYRKLGYLEYGTRPFEDPHALRPAHFILMSKALSR